MHLRLIIRQIMHARQQALVVVLCVALSIMGLVAIGGLRESVEASVSASARELAAGDIVISSNDPLGPAIAGEIAALEAEGMEGAAYYELLSVVQAGNGSMLAGLKVIEPGYPFYGTVELGSGEPFEVRQGEVIVEQQLLDRLGIGIGSRVQIGLANFTVADTVVREPDRGNEVFSLGPRIFVSAADKEALGLFVAGSRIEYTYLLKVPPERMEEAEERLSVAAVPREERVRTALQASSRLQRFIDNFLFFLSLVSVFTALLAGFGIYSTIDAFLRERTKSIATMKTVGATARFIMRQYLSLTLALGAAGTLLGISAGLALQQLLPTLFAGLLPGEIVMRVSWPAILQGMVLGILITLLFAALPLLALRELKPLAIFRDDEMRARSWQRIAVGAAVLVFFGTLIALQFGDPLLSLLLTAGIILLTGAAALLTEIALRALRRSRLPALALRQAVRGLFRPGNATRLSIVTLGTALAFLFAIILIESNLAASFVDSYPPGSPNLFIIDIQPSQVATLRGILPEGTVFYPIVTARVLSINGEPVTRSRQRTGDSITREFRMTYREGLLPTESLVDGDGLFGAYDVPVSVHTDFVEMSGVGIGDTIVFNVQGVPLEARVASIRTSQEGSLTPYFYFVFPPDVLEKAPTTLFTAVAVEKDGIAPLQTRIAQALPTLTVIDVTQVIETLAGLLRRISRIVRFFTGFAIAAGVLIVISAALATQYARTREAVYFKVLGGTGRFVRTVFAAENLMIGALSAMIGLAIAQAGSYLLVTRSFGLQYTPAPVMSLLMVLGAVAIIVITGILTSRKILNRKPVHFLHEE